MKKKVLATVLATAMVAGSLVGCGNSDTAAETTDTTATEETTEAAPADDAAAEETTEAEAAPADDAADPVANLIAATTDTV